MITISFLAVIAFIVLIDLAGRALDHAYECRRDIKRRLAVIPRHGE